VTKTGRAVIVHEACRNGGVGAEVAASIAEGAYLELKAPVIRVTGYDTVMPYYRNEQAYLPQTDDIVEAAKRVIAL